MSKKEFFPTVNPLFSERRELIEQSRQQVAVTVNSAMSRLYWQVGKRINEEVLNLERADYGEQIVQTLSAQLTAEYGKGFSKRKKNLLLSWVRTLLLWHVKNALL